MAVQIKNCLVTRTNLTVEFYLVTSLQVSHVTQRSVKIHTRLMVGGWVRLLSARTQSTCEC